MASLPGTISALSDGEKYELLDALWEDLEAHAFTLGVEQAEELDRREASYEKEPSAVVAWDQVRARQSSKQ